VVKRLKLTKFVQATKTPDFAVCYPNTASEIDTEQTCLDYEVSLLRLLEKVTNGTVIEISLTGVLYLISIDADLTRFKVPLSLSNLESSPEDHSSTNALFHDL
jgi:hypothetical protein